MADRYWVGGAGTWNSSDTSHWATGTGGSSGASVPTSSDSVFFDGNSGTGTITCSGSINCLDLTCTSAVGALTFSGGGSANLTVAGSFTLHANISGFTSFNALIFSATSTGKTITTAGEITTLQSFQFLGSGGGWTFQDGFSGNFTIISQTNGTLNLNGQTITCGGYNNGSGTCTLNMTSSTLTVKGGFTIQSGSTLTSTGSTLIIDYDNQSSFTAVGKTFNNLSITPTNGHNGLYMDLAGDLTVNGTFTATGTGAAGRVKIVSNTIGTARTITAAAVSLTDVIFRDVTGAGAASWTGTRVGDAKGNSGITFTAGASKYWVGNTNNWGTASWATSSGGAGSTDNVPLPQDDAIFDANSFSADGQTITLTSVAIHCKSISFANVDQAVTFDTGSRTIDIHGDLTLKSGMTFTGTVGTQINFAGRTSQTVTSNGVTITKLIELNSLGGTLVLGDNLTVSSSSMANGFILSRGTLDLNGKILSTPRFVSQFTASKTITPNGGSFTLTGNGGTIFNVPSSGLTLTTVPTFNCNYSGAAGTRTFLGSSTEAASVNINVTAGTDNVDFTTGFANVDFTGSSAILNTSSWTIYGNITYSTGMTVNAGALTTTFGKSSGTQTLTTNGKALNFPITKTGAGTLQLSDALTMDSTRTFSLSTGTLNLNGFVLSTGQFLSSSSNTRTITPSGGSFTITGNNQAVVQVSATNLTVTTVPTFNCTYSGGTGTRTISLSSFSESSIPNINITAGTDIVFIAGSNAVGTLNFTGFSGSLSDSLFTVYRDLVISLGMTLPSSNSVMTFGATSGTQSITSNGKTFNFPVTFSNASSIRRFIDDFTMGSTRTLTVSGGTVDLNGRLVQLGTFDSSNSNNRTLRSSVNGGVVRTLTTTAFSSGWNMSTSTGAVIDRTSGAWEIQIGGNTTNKRIFAGGDLTYPKVSFINTTAAGGLDITGSNTFKALKSTSNQTIRFTAGTTTKIEDDDGFPSGRPGGYVVITSITSSAHTLQKISGSYVSVDFLDISFSTAIPNNVWYAGTGSFNDSNNSGWNFVPLTQVRPGKTKFRMLSS